MKPDLVIGTDRLELYEYLSRTKETFSAKNYKLLRLCMAITVLHLVVVQIPTQFSRFFGDEVSSAEIKLGAKDQSDIGKKMTRMKSEV